MPLLCEPTSAAVGARWSFQFTRAVAMRPYRRAGAVWFASAMGLLDDAIREHLELKRLRGADPGAVAREEQDALGPVRRGGRAEHEPDDRPESSSRDGGQSLPDSESASEVDSDEVGQETVEINMEAELSVGASVENPPEIDRAKHAGAPVHPAHGRTISEESLEWEVPGEQSDELQTRGGSGDEMNSQIDRIEADGKPVEDVLEETPDFLRDTPEQERLWFEQRPPRDFDFNK
jgi:hypothetical protein